MRIICTMPVRNEDWCIGLTARAVLRWCDMLVISDHLSTDRTPVILDDIRAEVGSHRLTVTGWHDPVWSEMAQRQEMLNIARDFGATHVVMVDADEILSGNLVPVMADIVRRLPVGATLQLPWIQLRGSIMKMHASGVWAEQNVSMAFKDQPECHWMARDGYDFHHRHAMGMNMEPYRPFRGVEHGGLMHLQMVNDYRLRAKQALYKMQEVIRWPDRIPMSEVNKMYNLAVYGSPQETGVPTWVPPGARVERRAGEAPPRGEFTVVPYTFWEAYQPIMDHLAVERHPWQVGACHELMKIHGPMKFKGLDLFNIV